MINNKQQNLHQYKILMEVPELNNKNRQIWLKKTLTNAPKKDYKDLVKLSIKLYDKSYSGLDLLNYIEHTYISNTYDRYKLLVVLHKIKREYRNEKLFMLFILNYMFLRSDIDLENITFM
jgi:hypothetical protein